MGANDSKQAAIYPNLDEDEMKYISSKFHHQKSMDKNTFSSAFSLVDLSRALFIELGKDGKVKQEHILGIANALKGDVDQMAEILLQIFKSTRKMLESITSHFAVQNKASGSDAAMLLEHLNVEAPSEDNLLSKWLISNPFIINLIRESFSPLWRAEPSKLLLPNLDSKSILLSPAALVVLNGNLPMDRRAKWTQLFSSEKHGSSFAQLLKRISGEGPCLLVIRSNNNRVFGCFASQGFLCGPKYRGDATSFLFEIKPILRIYAANQTDNLAYMNCQQETLPNGLGIGGDGQNWPLFIHEDFDSGISTPNMRSFERCHIAGESEFRVSEVEAWRVGEKERLSIEEEERVRVQKSIIDKDPEAKALLEMSGRKMHSEAYREPAPILDED